MRFLGISAAVCLCISTANAHDPWVESNTAVARVGEAVDVDLKLGNHGNDHRDFKLAGRLNLDWVKFDLVGPDGSTFDLKPTATDTALAPKEGYWTARASLEKPGLYTVAQSMDRVVNHGKPIRGVRSAKTFVLAAESLDQPVAPKASAAGAALGLPFELVFDQCPATAVGLGRPLAVRVLKNGKPAEGVRVAFIPRGATLKEGFDADYERTTDADGRATWTPRESTTVLIAAHSSAPDEKGADYEATSYAATATVRVPLKCQCCDGSESAAAGR
ncbi:MAG: DUF4198 domain-containing protein [Planctomycetia bacterium]